MIRFFRVETPAGSRLGGRLSACQFPVRSVVERTKVMVSNQCAGTQYKLDSRISPALSARMAKIGHRWLSLGICSSRKVRTMTTLHLAREPVVHSNNDPTPDTSDLDRSQCRPRWSYSITNFAFLLTAGKSTLSLLLSVRYDSQSEPCRLSCMHTRYSARPILHGSQRGR